MPVIDISNIPNIVFGVCCIEGAERERIQKQWNDRFSARTAFFVDAKPGDSSPEIVQKICDEIAAQGITTMVGKPCVLAVFLDLTKELDADMQTALWQLNDRLRMALMCNVQTVLQFGYVGKLGLGSVKIQRAGLDAVIECNRKKSAAVQHRICLVGSPLLTVDGGNNWKSVMVLLDAMRRQVNPTEPLPGTIGETANDDVGFLRYGEFDQKVYDALLAEQEMLSRQMGSGGSDAFSKVLEDRRSAMRTQVTNNFPIDGTAQPQHTNMIVGNSFLDSKRRQARNGTNSSYNLARQETKSAVMLTEKRMCEQIENLLAPTIAAADETLLALFNEAKAGVDFKKDRVSVEALLAGIKAQELSTANLELQYDENGCWQEIQNYLLYSRNRTLNRQVEKFNQALVDAYDRLWKGGFAQELDTLQGRLEKVKIRISSTKTAEQFCKDIAFGQDPPESVFQPAFAVGDSATFILSRGEQMRNTVNAALTGYTKVRTYEIAEVGGGLQVIDDAPLKAVQVVFLNYNETAVNELLPEVE